MFGMYVELSNPSAAFSFSTRTGPADGQRIGVNACHTWEKN